MKFEHQISEGTYHIGPESQELFCFYCTTLNYERKTKNGPYALIGARSGKTLWHHVVNFDE